MTAPAPKNLIVVGYTTQEHLLVDLDKCSWLKAQAVAKMIMRQWPVVGDCLIVRSSPFHFHLVFDNQLDWDTIVRIIETLADLGIVEEKYRQVRHFRRDLTLRVSDKIGEQRNYPVPQPKLILQHRGSDSRYKGIQRYLQILAAFTEAEYDLIPKEVISE